ncbi:MAG: hypothetical protein ACK5OS_01895 [Chryseotalea sp.]
MMNYGYATSNYIPGEDQQLGNIFKKARKRIKKVGDKIGSTKVIKAVKKGADKLADTKVGRAVTDVGKGVVNVVTAPVSIVTGKDVYSKDDFRTKVGRGANQAFQKVTDTVNRFVNPITILLRNGILLAMKVNMFNVAKKLRFAYLTDAQAQAQGINLPELQKVRNQLRNLERRYDEAGGKPSNLKKAILSGAGNKDRKVPLSGLGGFQGDAMEYNILRYGSPYANGTLGVDPGSGAALAAASSVVGIIATALSTIKLFKNEQQNQELNAQVPMDPAAYNDGTVLSASDTAGENQGTGSGLSTGAKVGIGLALFGTVFLIAVAAGSGDSKSKSKS